jgi:hypothetical protein
MLTKAPSGVVAFKSLRASVSPVFGPSVHWSCRLSSSERVARGSGAATGAEMTTWPNKSSTRPVARHPEADVVWRTFISKRGDK